MHHHVSLCVCYHSSTHYLKKDKQALESKDLLKMKNIIQTYVEKVVVYEDRLDITFKIVDFNGGGGGCRTHVRKDDHSPVYEHSLAT